MVVGGTVFFDESTWPVVIMRCAPVLSKDSARDVIDGVERLLSRRDRYALIIDTTPVKAMPDAAWRKAITDWANDPETYRKSAKYGLGTALIMLSPMVRGIFTAISWIVKHPTPQYAAADMADAVSWCCEQLVRAGVPRSRALIELQESQRMAR